MITAEGFLDDFISRHEKMSDRPFCWILGSGASRQSGIPTGVDFARQWLADMHKRENFKGQSLEQWATADNLGIPGFDYKHAANFYPQIFQRRYQDYPEQGYAFLEAAMDHSEPSFGYAALAQIMSNTAHKVAITTNFDNLISDALSIYTQTFPLVCGHESLTGYIRANLRRPLIAKIHRDLLLHPLNNPGEVDLLPEAWTAALRKIFARFTPIVIGYGGNDGSLMGFLQNLEPIEGGIFWCHRADSAIDERVHAVVNRHKGRRVPIAGFDELMLQLREKLGLPDALPEVERIHKQRVDEYREQFEHLSKAISQPAADPAAEAIRAPVRRAAESAVGRIEKENGWWHWGLSALLEKDADKKVAIYEEGLKSFPDSAALLGGYANFLRLERKDMGAAEALYKRAIEADTKDADNLGNYASFLRHERKDMDAAETLYKRAIEADPKHANNLGNYANFLHQERKDMDAAEALYKRAIEDDPKHANHLGNYAIFLHQERKDMDAAEALYKRAIDADPKHANNLGNYANFLRQERKDMDAAEALYKRAIEADPKDANHLGNYANFLCNERKDMDAAEALYKRAIEADPKHANNLANCAGLQLAKGKNVGLQTLQQAWAAFKERPLPAAELECAFYGYAHGPVQQQPEALSRARQLLLAGTRSPGWDLSMNIARAVDDGHPEAAWLEKLAIVINDKAKLETLDAWPAWRKAAET